jgi:outer membrane lipoprotein SlyB
MPARPTLLLLALLAGCGPRYSPDTYNASAVQQAAKVERGIVIGIRTVGVTTSGATGAVTGGAAGGIAGSQIGGGGVTGAIGALGGGVIGSLVGATVEQGTADTPAIEYIVRKPNGELVSVTQQDKQPLALGQKVLVIAGSQARIVADYTIEPQPPPPPAAKAPDPVIPTPATEPPPPM